ncbi:MAG: hypothetical protein BMS9Abin13_517 [Patescibacteria group bacterium]|nr:MAG: hypothetical protein BMS9Abin13_517 [Patescibacteria group bacterium]
MRIINILSKKSLSVNILLAIGIASATLLFYGYLVERSTGTIIVSIPEKGAVIFLDDKRVDTTARYGQTVTLKRLRAGDHSVLVYTQGFFPWEKTLGVRKNETTEVSAFFVKQDISPTKIFDEEYSAVSVLFEKKRSDIKRSWSREVEIRKNAGEIAARWIGDASSLPFYFCDKNSCGDSTVVFRAQDGDISAFDFYPGREDVVLFALQNAIYAIEIDKRGIQNFQPLYAGASPDFVIKEGTSIIYIKDAGSLLRAQL